MIKILVVEDDINIAKTITAAISIVGYETEIVNDGEKALQFIQDNTYDLILLDVMLPKMSGFEIMDKIKFRNIPVIFLTALSNVTDKVQGLYSGAEDYITKPFEAMELLARIEVVLRRSNKAETIYNYEDIVLDISKHSITKKDELVSLTPKEFDLIAFFMKNVDVVITREKLINYVWGYEFQGESRTVDIHIQQVRKKLDLAGKLVTIPKLGYRLEKLK